MLNFSDITMRFVNNFTDKQKMQTKALFKLDLRIDKKMIKLNVFQEDAMSDVIQRLVKTITWKEIARDKVKNRLEEQFKKIMQEQALSYAVKRKINELMEESKLVIVNVETSHRNEPTLNETPFRILQDSVNNYKKIPARPAKKHYHYLDNLIPDLSYDPEYPNSAKIFDNIKLGLNTQNRYPLEQYPKELRKKDSCSELIQRKYAAIDKKCEDYITRHEELNNMYKLTRNQAEENCYRYSRERSPCLAENNQRQLGRYSQQRISRERQPLAVNQNRLNCNYNEYNTKGTYQSGESFQDYKINRYKSTKSFAANPKYQHVTQREPTPSRSLSRTPQKQSNTMVLLRKYDDEPQSYNNSSQNYISRQGRKFSYNMP